MLSFLVEEQSDVRYHDDYAMKSTESITRRNKLLMVYFQERFITRLGSRMKRDVCHVWPVIIVMALGILFLKRSV